MKYAFVAMATVLFSAGAWSNTCEASKRIGDRRMPTPVETVIAFSAAVPKENGTAAIRRWFTPGTVWVNEGVSITIGIDDAIRFLERPDRSPDIAAVHFDMLAIAADGNRVLTERLDRFVRADGSAIASVKVMGIFEVDGGCIVAWRDYFDVNFAKKISKNSR